MRAINFVLITLFLGSLLLQSAAARPDDSTSQAGSPRPPASSFTLFGAVTHSDSLKHVDHALNKHKESLKGAKTDTASKELAASAAGSSATASNTIASTGSPQIQASINQAELPKKTYVPLTGIAQPTADSNKTLNAQAHKFEAEWFMIPPWMAGKWVKEGDLTVRLTDLQTGSQSNPNEFVPNKMEATWGHQKDAAGNVWHVNFLPSERTGQSEGKNVHFLVVMQKCEKSDTQSLLTRTHYVVSESNFLTGQAIDMFQQESLNHYVPSSSTEMVNVSTNRVFTYQGQAVRDGHLQSTYNRVSQFQPLSTLNGIDLKESLNDYLDEHGLTHLKIQ